MADDAVDRLEEIAAAADSARTRSEIDAVAGDLDRFALEAARELRRDDASLVDATALGIAISTARAKLDRKASAANTKTEA